MARILIVDDDEKIIKVLSSVIRTKNHDVMTASDGREGLELLSSTEFDLVISDVQMQQMDGLDLLKQAIELYSDLPFILVTGHGSVQVAVDALKHGAFDFVTKPFRLSALLEMVDRALEYGRATRSVSGSSRPDVQYCIGRIIAVSRSMKKVCDQIQRAAASSVPVLIRGEIATGKVLAAEALHETSSRAEQPFVVIDCAKTAEEVVEKQIFSDEGGIARKAAGGTVVFQDIQGLSIELQKRLLALCQREGAIIRLVATLGEGGELVPELEKLLCSTEIEIPPLRERKEDILPIAFGVLDQVTEDGESWSVDWKARLTLEGYEWPGNVHELENAIRYAVAFAEEDVLLKEDLPPKLAKIPVDEEAAAAAAKVEDMKGTSARGYLRTAMTRMSGQSPSGTGE